MFGGWKYKALHLKTILLSGGWQTAKDLAPSLRALLDVFAEAAQTGETTRLQDKIEALTPLTDAERPLHEPADINGWKLEAMLYRKEGEIWWLVHAVRKNEQPPREKDVKLLYHVLEILGGTPADAIIAPASSPITTNLPFGWWTWRNVAPLMEIQVNPNRKGKDSMRIVRHGAPETDGFTKLRDPKEG